MEADAESRTVVVRCQPLDPGQKDLFHQYFGNEKFSGGGAIKEEGIVWNEEQRCYFITFVDSFVARRVACRQHSQINHPVQVELWPVPASHSGAAEAHENIVLVSGVPGETTPDCLLNYLECQLDINVKTVQLNRRDGTALIVFNSPLGKIETEWMERACQAEPLEKGVMLTFQRVPVSKTRAPGVCSTVRVMGLKPETDTQTIKYFFSNRKRSHGGPVQSVDRDPGSTVALVHFVNSSDAESVVNKGNHVLDGYSLSLCLHDGPKSGCMPGQQGAEMLLQQAVSLPQETHSPQEALSLSDAISGFRASAKETRPWGQTWLPNSRSEMYSTRGLKSSFDRSLTGSPACVQVKGWLDTDSAPGMENTHTPSTERGFTGNQFFCTASGQTRNVRDTEPKDAASYVPGHASRSLVFHKSSRPPGSFLGSRANSNDPHHASTAGDGRGSLMGYEYPASASSVNSALLSSHSHQPKDNSDKEGRGSFPPARGSPQASASHSGVEHNSCPELDFTPDVVHGKPPLKTLRLELGAYVVQAIMNDSFVVNAMIRELKSVKSKHRWERPHHIVIRCQTRNPGENWERRVQEIMHDLVEPVKERVLRKRGALRPALSPEESGETGTKATSSAVDVAAAAAADAPDDSAEDTQEPPSPGAVEDLFPRLELDEMKVRRPPQAVEKLTQGYPGLDVISVDEELTTATVRAEDACWLETSLGKLTVIVKVGDILTEPCHAIISNNNDNLDQAFGLFKEIRQVCGETLIAECRTQRRAMSLTGVAAIRVESGGLPCDSVINVSGNRFRHNWEEGILAALELADREGFRSIAMPALGTGGKGVNPMALAEAMQRAVSRFSDHARAVREVLVVLVEEFLLTVYMNAFDPGIAAGGEEGRDNSPERKPEFSLPTYWAPMDRQTVKRVQLAPEGNEYRRVAELFGRQAHIEMIERIQNPALFKQYMEKKKEMEQYNPKGTSNEKRLFYGVPPDKVNSIIANGFSLHNCGTDFGKKVYFSTSSVMSAGFARPGHVFVVRVLVGEYTSGVSGMRMPPRKPNSGRPYDSVSNAPVDPTVFIIFHDSQAYPEYLVSYT